MHVRDLSVYVCVSVVDMHKQDTHLQGRNLFDYCMTINFGPFKLSIELRHTHVAS